MCIFNFFCEFLLSHLLYSIQFTSNQHSLPSTDHAAPHSAVLFIPLLLSLPKKISSFPVLALFFHVLSLEHKDTPSNTHNSVYPKLSIHNSVLLCTISVICVNSCVLNSFTIKGFKEVNYFMLSQIILCYN